MIERKGLHHIAMRVKDLGATIAFYEALGCKVQRTWVRDGLTNCMIDAGGTELMEVFSGGTDNAEAFPRFEHLSFRSSDPDADFAAALAAGARPKVEPKDISQGDAFRARIAFVFGPDDEVIEFIKEL